MSEESKEQSQLVKALEVPSAFVVLISAVKIVEALADVSFARLGMFPRAAHGLIGVFTTPLLHGDLEHLVSNAFPLLVLGAGIGVFYPTVRNKIFLSVYFGSTALLWIFGREVYHIGASGVVYGLASFAFFSGVVRRDSRAMALAFITVFLYGGLVWGVLPIKEGMSWDGHLTGAVAGFIAAIVFRKDDPHQRYDWEDEDEDPTPEDLKISHDKPYPF
jgi:membrane associated rhomboid family serine protease